jgi:hypothetical protein
MYMGSTGQFASTTYYMQQHPAWVNAFKRARPADKYWRTEWKPLLPESAYARSCRTASPGTASVAASCRWRCRRGRERSRTPAFYASLLPSPFADATVADFARAAIAGEAWAATTPPTSWRSACRATTTSTIPERRIAALARPLPADSIACSKPSSATSTPPSARATTSRC